MGYQYRNTWVQVVPVSHRSKVQVHGHHYLGKQGCLAAYQLVGPIRLPNDINVHLPFGTATNTFLEHLMQAYQQLAMMGPTVIIGDFNAAPTVEDRGGPPTPEDTAVKVAMQHLGLQDLTTSLRGQPSHRQPKPGSTDGRIQLCYMDPAHVEVTRTRYQDLPSKATGHCPLEVQVKVLPVLPTFLEDSKQDEQPPFKPPDEHDTHKWMAYNSTVH